MLARYRTLRLEEVTWFSGLVARSLFSPLLADLKPLTFFTIAR
jgi:hypothetical protein